MKINYRLEIEDYINFNLYHTHHSPSLKKIVVVQKILPPIIFVVLGLIFAGVFGLSLKLSLGIYTVLAILWFLYYPTYFKRTIRSRVTKMMNEGDNKGLLGAYEMDLSEDGFTVISDNQNSQLSWSAIKSLEITSEYIYLYNSSISAYIIPKKSIDDMDIEKSFIDFVTSHIE